MEINVSFNLGFAGSPTRARARVTGFGVGRKDIDAEITRVLRPVLQRSVERIKDDYRYAYGTLADPRTYVRKSGASLLGGLTITDRRFFFHEWDTQPHWPPFGKYSELAAWAREHGMDRRAAFFIARKMAPEGATNAETAGYLWHNRAGEMKIRSHRMTVTGLGGYESRERPPRRVATSGKYAVTTAFERETGTLQVEIADRLEGVLTSLAGDAGDGL